MCIRVCQIEWIAKKYMSLFSIFDIFFFAINNYAFGIMQIGGYAEHKRERERERQLGAP